MARRLPAHRWAHSLGTATVARELAPRLGADPAKAWIAGLVHDIARDLPAGELLSLAGCFGILVDTVEREAPELLHGPVGAELARRELGVDDPEILDAVARHTVGGAGLRPLSLLLYLADFIEPNRDFPGVEEVRQTARRDPELAALWTMEKTLTYLFREGLPAHPATLEGRNFLLSRLVKEGRWRPWGGGAQDARCHDRAHAGSNETRTEKE
ncbi:MAG: bis(5'-nucleosyl)-tetraphosphatase (symmetrical) YqeK [Bacillota bacterium]